LAAARGGPIGMVMGAVFGFLAPSSGSSLAKLSVRRSPRMASCAG
jgi:hypothetical protein